MGPKSFDCEVGMVNFVLEGNILFLALGWVLVAKREWWKFNFFNFSSFFWKEEGLGILGKLKLDFG